MANLLEPVTPEELYFKARNTVLEMMEDRGYVLVNGADFSTLRMSQADFSDNYKMHASNSNVLDITGIRDTTGREVLVTFVESGKSLSKPFDNDGIFKAVHNGLGLSGAPNAKELDLKNKQLFLNALVASYHVIIVYNSLKKNESLADSDAKSHTQPHQFIELFPAKRISFNPTTSFAVPQHIIMSDAEVKTLFEEKNMSLSKCAKIQSNDAINLYYNGQPGQVYKLIREGKQIQYRAVVKASSQMSTTGAMIASNF